MRIANQEIVCPDFSQIAHTVSCNESQLLRPFVFVIGLNAPFLKTAGLLSMLMPLGKERSSSNGARLANVATSRTELSHSSLLLTKTCGLSLSPEGRKQSRQWREKALKNWRRCKTLLNESKNTPVSVINCATSSLSACLWASSRFLEISEIFNAKLMRFCVTKHSLCVKMCSSAFQGDPQST